MPMSKKRQSTELCCTGEQRSDSPPLPNARVADGFKPQQPLLPQPAQEDESRFHTTRTEDIEHELQTIFETAATVDEDSFPPDIRRNRQDGVTTSHDVDSRPENLASRLRKRLSFASTKSTQSQGKRRKAKSDASPGGPTSNELQTMKQKLSKDLLSDQTRSEGGYDSDAEAIEDAAFEAFQRYAQSPGNGSPIRSRAESFRRTDLRSIEWARPELEQDPKPDGNRNMEAAYQGDAVNNPRRLTPTAPLAYQAFESSSVPDLAAEVHHVRAIRRSLSETSISMPPPPKLQPKRLPSTSGSVDSPLWKLSVPDSNKPAEGVSRSPSVADRKDSVVQGLNFNCDTNEWPLRSTSVSGLTHTLPVANALDDVIREPARDALEATTGGNGESASVRSMGAEVGGNGSQLTTKHHIAGSNSNELDTEPDEPKSSAASVHLYNMRISQHLRSASTLSVTPSVKQASGAQHGRTRSSLSVASKAAPRSRHQRQSSSGFASAKVPTGWGNVVSEASSVYSTRPNSPESLRLPPVPGAYSIPQSMLRNETMLDGSNSNTPVAGLSPSKPSASSQVIEHTYLNTPNKERFAHDAQGSKQRSNLSAAAANNSSSSSLGKASKFREELTPSPPKKKAKSKKRKSFRLFQHKSKTRVRAVSMFDGSGYDEAPIEEREPGRLQRSMLFVGDVDQAGALWEKATKAYQAEKSAMYLSPENAKSAGLFRQRSASAAVPTLRSLSSMADPTDREGRPSLADTRQVRSMSHLKGGAFLAPPEQAGGKPSSPSITTKPSIASYKSVRSFHSIPSSQLEEIMNEASASTWSRYPSHTRPQRTGSAGAADNVITRDFATVFSPAADINSSDSDSTIKRKATQRKKARVGMVKSRSMTFGKNFLKSYANIFRSQSREFRVSGHRSSIAAGGRLEYPELELVAPVMYSSIPEIAVVDAETERKQGKKPKVEKAESKDDEGLNKWTTKLAEKGVPSNSKWEFAFSNAGPSRTSATRGDHDEEIDPATALPASLMSGALPSRVDGSAESNTAMPAALRWSQFYDSCVQLPGSAEDDTVSLKDNLAGHLGVASIDSTLRSPIYQSNNLPADGRRSASYVYSDASSKSLPVRMRHMHDKNMSVTSVASMTRASTNDLLALMQERERAEREKLMRGAEEAWAL